MKKKNPTFLQLLVTACRLGQFYIGMFLLSSLLVFSIATPLVESKAGNVAFIIGPTYPRVHISKIGNSTFFESVARMGLGWLWFVDMDPVLSYEGLGNISLGPLRFSTGDRYRLSMKNMSGEAVQMDSLNGMVSFIRPAHAAEILDAIQWPFLSSVFCFGGLNIAILEMLRRILKKVSQGDAFTPASIRGVQVIGLLFIASGFLQPLTTGWLKHEIAVYAANHLATGMFFDTRSISNYPVIFTGAVILALAELFRQGLTIKEENTLTI